MKYYPRINLIDIQELQTQKLRRITKLGRISPVLFIEEITY